MSALARLVAAAGAAVVARGSRHLALDTGQSAVAAGSDGAHELNPKPLAWGGLLAGSREEPRPPSALQAQRINPLPAGALARVGEAGNLGPVAAKLSAAFPLEGGQPGAEGRIRTRSVRALVVQRGATLLPESQGFSLVAEMPMPSRGVESWWWAILTTPEGVHERVAVKVQRRYMGLVRNLVARDRAAREAEIMHMLPDGPFVEFYGLKERFDCQLLIFKLAEGSLQRVIIDPRTRKRKASMKARIELFSDLLDGLRILEANGWVHRSIWPDNLMVEKVNGRYRLRIGGFDHAIGPTERLRRTPGEEFYRMSARTTLRAPETWGVDFNSKTDVYFAGLVLYQMLFDGALPQRFAAVQEQGDLWFTKFKEPWSVYDVMHDNLLGDAKFEATRTSNAFATELLEILEWMLAKNEDDRPTAAQAYAAVQALGKPKALPAKYKYRPLL